MNNIRVEIDALNATISNLILSYPELQEDETLRSDTFEGCSSMHEVLSRLLDMSQEAKSMAQAIKLRTDDLAARKARYERQEEGFRTLMQSVMERAGLPKVILPEATLSITHRKPAPFVTNEAALPDEFVTIVTTRKPNLEAIKTAVEKTSQLPAGVSMTNGRSSLVVRVK